MRPTIFKKVVLAVTLTAAAGTVLADGRHVRWLDQPTARPSGQPERVMRQQLGPRVSANLERRGLMAQQARGAAPRVHSRRAGAGYNNVRYDRRVGQPKSILKGSTANRAVRTERSFTRNLGASTRATMTHRGDVARHARKGPAIKSTLSRAAKSGKVARHAKTARTLGKAAAGGFVATYVTESALGVDIPDAFDAAEWTYGTLKDPSKAPERFERLGRNSVRTLDKAGRTLTNPEQMGRNLESAGKKAVNTVGKAGCAIGGLFGAKC